VSKLVNHAELSSYKIKIKLTSEIKLRGENKKTNGEKLNDIQRAGI